MELDLASMSVEDKRALHAQLAYALREEVGSGRSADPEAISLYSALRDALKARSIGCPYWKAFATSYGVTAFQERVVMMDDFLATALPAKAEKRVRESVKRLALDCLIAYIAKRGQALTPAYVLNNFQYLKYAVDRDYPGYVDAQLLQWTIEFSVA